MSSAIVTLIIAFTFLSGVAILAQSSFASMRDITDAWQQREVRFGDIARTGLQVLTTSHSPPQVDITLKNSGQVSLRDFKSWDVIVQYYRTTGTYHVKRLTYTATNPPGDDQWTVVGIYRNAGLGQAEIFQPNILDPGEEMIIRLKLAPAADAAVQNLASINTPNGVSITTMF